MKLLITPEARRDLESIGDWIAKDSPLRAVAFVEELELSCAEILLFPEKYPVAIRYEKMALRRKVHGNYLIFYRVVTDQVQIIHILHGARDYEGLLFPLA
jgi:toxin ParE1/3/4